MTFNSLNEVLIKSQLFIDQAQLQSWLAITPRLLIIYNICISACTPSLHIPHRREEKRREETFYELCNYTSNGVTQSIYRWSVILSIVYFLHSKLNSEVLIDLA